jgi:hypothetical protein
MELQEYLADYTNKKLEGIELRVRDKKRNITTIISIAGGITYDGHTWQIPFNGEVQHLSNQGYIPSAFESIMEDFGTKGVKFDSILIKNSQIYIEVNNKSINITDLYDWEVFVEKVLA